MIGTIRTLDKEMKEYIRERIKNMVPNLAKAYRATASVEIVDGADITYNDPMLTKEMIPSLEKVVGIDNVIEISAVTGAEDFSYFQSKIPGLELISIAVPEDSSIIGQALEDIELPPHSFIAIVMKDNRAEPPIDKLIIEAHDEIVAVTTPEEEAVMYDILTGVL